jgi:putative tryptophan/tyrosine transport system substrate-binding protein
MRRREFIAGVGGAVAWPLRARAQRPERTRRVGMLLPYVESDSTRQPIISAFTRQLAELGWVEGRNLQMEIRWAGGSVEEARRHAKELVALQSDVILSDSTPQTAALQLATRSIPIVFVLVADPIGSGFVAGLPRPGSNLTGFTHLEGTMGGKWLDLLRQVVPGLRRAAAIFNPETAPYVKPHYLPAFEAAARLSKVEPLVASVNSEVEIVQIIGSLGEQPGGGLVLMSDAFVYNHRSLIISHAIQKGTSNNDEFFVGSIAGSARR